MNFAWTAPWIDRWNALAVRERRVISALGVSLGVVLFYLAIWNPVHDGLARARARASAVQAQLARVREQGVLVSTLRNTPRVALPANLVAAVGQAAERHGLREQVKRVDAEGARAVRVQVEGAPLSALTAWLVELQRGGLRAERATLERQANPGTVNAQLVLRAQGP